MRVTYAFDPALEQVLADKVQIQQVVLNLMRNAIEAMENAPRRELMIATERGEDGMAIVKVVDTGTGIPPEIASQLFQPFVTTKPQGMGVGLSISRTIVESHGGADQGRAQSGRRHDFPVHPSQREPEDMRDALIQSSTSSMTTKRCGNRSNFCCAAPGLRRGPTILHRRSWPHRRERRPDA